MKKRNKSFDIFNLSFLDIISCGFGAVIMLILISKPNEAVDIISETVISNLVSIIIELENNIARTEGEIEEKNNIYAIAIKNNDSINKLITENKGAASSQENLKSSIVEDIQGLSLVETTLKQASISTPSSKNQIRDEEVGGIPVDSDYVIFVIDTSGSMRQIWPKVTSEIINVLNIHPRVKGFQILNDMGKSIISGYEGKWIPDTERRRKNVIALFQNWGDYSNSSPVEGIEVALRKYAKPSITTSIYVFGDDYTGASYDPVIDKITSMNKIAIGDKQLAKIHGVGFISLGTTDRFGILMRELTKQNGGTLLSLPVR